MRARAESEAPSVTTNVKRELMPHEKAERDGRRFGVKLPQEIGKEARLLAQAKEWAAFNAHYEANAYRYATVDAIQHAEQWRDKLTLRQRRGVLRTLAKVYGLKVRRKAVSK